MDPMMSHCEYQLTLIAAMANSARAAKSQQHHRVSGLSRGDMALCRTQHSSGRARQR